jgi:hypothetical protein
MHLTLNGWLTYQSYLAKQFINLNLLQKRTALPAMFAANTAGSIV